MTREEAIKWFEESPFYHKDHKPFNMAIKALSQEPCDDAISREAVIKILEKYNLEMSKIAEDVSELPSVTQKSGKWIVDSPHYVCSKCNYVHHLQRFEVMSGCKLGNFCPNCGAKMEGEEISERNMKMWEEIFKAESEVRNETDNQHIR